MGIALAQARNGTIGARSSSLSSGFTLQTVNIGDKLVVIFFGLTTTISGLSCADNSTQAGTANTYTAVEAFVSGGTPGIIVFWCDVTRSILTTDAITLSFTGASKVCCLGISDWTGVATGAPNAFHHSTPTSATPDTGALTVAPEVGDLLIAGFSHAAVDAYTPGADGQGNTMTSLFAPAPASSRSCGAQYLVESAAQIFTPAASFAGSAVNACEGVLFSPGASSLFKTMTPTPQAQAVALGRSVSKILVP